MTNRAHAIDHRAEGQFGGNAGPERALPAGTRLREYEITSVLVDGGLDIVYLAWDASLQRKVAVKEYLPMALAGRVPGSTGVAPQHGDRPRDAFRAGLKSFVAEAKLLARFDHPSLVKVYRFWEDNGTAYRVMPLYEGPTLEAALANLDHVPSEEELRTWLKPVLNGLAVLHEGDALHQNIGPDTIVLTAVGPVLFGLGAAEQAIAALMHTSTSALKPGYAAIELYGNPADTKRGPWTDLYALGAVVYAAITGAPPPPATDRLADDTMRPLSVVAAGLYGERFLAAIDAALAVEPDRRPADHLQFRSLMGDIDAPAPLELAPARDLMHEPFAGAPAGEREITVPDHPLLDIAAAPAKAAAAKTGTPTPARTQPERPARGDRDAKRTPTAAEPAASWTRTPGRLGGMRLMYGLIAGTCVLIGVAALALQFYARQAGRPATVAPAAASAAPAVAAPSPDRTAVPVGTAPVSAASAIGGATATATSPAPATVTAPASGATPAQAQTPIATPASAPGPVAATRPSSTSDLTDPATPAERQARCVEILQKASLERITPAETNFFKRECK